MEVVTRLSSPRGARRRKGTGNKVTERLQVLPVNYLVTKESTFV